MADRLSSRWREPARGGRERLRETLEREVFSASLPGYLETVQGRGDLENHLWRRQEDDRTGVIPWLDDCVRLDGARILEIGAGTGSGTMALAEQGAEVVGVDINPSFLKAARARLETHGLRAELLVASATDVHQLPRARPFDWIIFWACLEHLTHEERMLSMRRTWEMLAPGAMWCVIEAPNRLWYKDTHTSMMPFYHWLPDDLALEYSRFSPRDGFGDAHTERTPEAMLAFLRRGRGVSFHEFDLTLGPAAGLDVVSSRSQFERRSFTPEQERDYLQSNEHRFSSQLAKMARVGEGLEMHEGWFQPWLDLVIRKR